MCTWSWSRRSCQVEPMRWEGRGRKARKEGGSPMSGGAQGRTGGGGTGATENGLMTRVWRCHSGFISLCATFNNPLEDNEGCLQWQPLSLVPQSRAKPCVQGSWSKCRCIWYVIGGTILEGAPTWHSGQFGQVHPEPFRNLRGWWSFVPKQIILSARKG